MMPFVKELSEEFPEITFAKFDTTGEPGTKLRTYRKKKNSSWVY